MSEPRKKMKRVIHKIIMKKRLGQINTSRMKRGKSVIQGITMGEIPQLNKIPSKNSFEEIIIQDSQLAVNIYNF